MKYIYNTMDDAKQTYSEKISVILEENAELVYSLIQFFICSTLLYFEEIWNIPELMIVIIRTSLVFSLVLIAREILRLVEIYVERKHAYIIICIFLILSNSSESNINYAPSTLSLIITLFAIRYLLYNFYIWSWRKQKGKPLEKKWNASFQTYIIIFFLLLPFGQHGFRIILMFLVYAIYDFMKIKYLTVSKKTEQITNNELKVYSEILKVDFIAWIIVLSLFMLYNNQVLGAGSQTLYYFYSTIAQVFSALLGIVIMFGILILQDGDKTTKNIFLKRGLHGFSFIYIFILILSMSGILVTNDLIQENTFDTLESLTSTQIRNIVNMGIFETTFLMTPVALLYLYGLVIEFLKLDKDENDEYQKTLSDY